MKNLTQPLRSLLFDDSTDPAPGGGPPNGPGSDGPVLPAPRPYGPLPDPPTGGGGGESNREPIIIYC